MIRRMTALLLIAFLLSSYVHADDWPHWLGPQRDATWRETDIIETFPEGGPPIAWRKPVAVGYSGPVVANGKVFVTDFVRSGTAVANDPGARSAIQGKERVLCLSEQDGSLLWTHEYDCSYEISYPGGPRCTPAVDGDRVYSLGAQGNLVCLDVASGQVRWRKDFVKDLGATVALWGYSSHPLVHGDLLICIVGGPGQVAVAFNKLTGEIVWKNLTAKEQGYSSPTIINVDGVEQLLVWDAETLHSLNPLDGKEHWSLPIAPQYGMSSATPRVSGDTLYATGIGRAGGAYRLEPRAAGAQPIWQNDGALGIFTSFCYPLIRDGIVYGSDCQVGDLRAAELLTGKRLWNTWQPTSGGTRRTSHGHAFIVQQGGREILFSETGDLIFAKLSPEKYEEISRFHVLEPTGEALGRNVVWTHPAYANGCAVIRNDQEIVRVVLRKPVAVASEK